MAERDGSASPADLSAGDVQLGDLPAGDLHAAVEQRLAGVADLPVQQHVGAYEDVCRLLSDALARLDEG